MQALRQERIRVAEAAPARGAWPEGGSQAPWSLVVDKRADDDAARCWIDVEDDLGVIGEEQIRSIRRSYDKDVMDSRLHQIGDLAETRTFLIDSLQAHQLVEEELPGR